MPAIIIRDGESFESALKRFKKQCEQDRYPVRDQKKRALRKTQRQKKEENSCRKEKGPEEAEKNDGEGPLLEEWHTKTKSNEGLKKALKEKDALRVSVLRMLLSSLGYKEIEKRKPLTRGRVSTGS